MSLRRSAAILCSGHRCGRSAGGPPAQTSCEGSYPGVHRCLRFRSKGCMLHTSHLRGTWLQGISEVHDPELRMLLQQLDAEHRLHCSAWTFWSVSLDSTLNGLQLRSESERARPLRAPSSSKSCLQAERAIKTKADIHTESQQSPASFEGGTRRQRRSMAPFPGPAGRGA